MKPEKSTKFLVCPKCNSELKKVKVKIEDAKLLQLVTSVKTAIIIASNQKAQ